MNVSGLFYGVAAGVTRGKALRKRTGLSIARGIEPRTIEAPLGGEPAMA